MAGSPADQTARSTSILLFGSYALVGGAISFLGWPCNVPRLTDWFNDGVSIQPNACVLITLSGIAIILTQWRAWRALMVLGTLVGLGGATILIQYLVGANFGINTLLLFGRTWGQGTTLTLGRVGPPASTSFTLIGIALVLMSAASLRPQYSHIRRFIPIIGVTVCLVMMFSLLGYMFGAQEFYTIPWLTAIALPTSTMLFAIAIALILCVPEHVPMLLLRENSGAGATARLTIPSITIMIPLVHLLCVKGFERGYFDQGTGRALGILTLIVGALAIVWNALMTVWRQEKAVLDADRRKDEFLATLAHELRNPLAPLQSGLEIIERSVEETEMVGKVIETMRSQVNHLTILVDDLLDVSRIATGKLKLRHQYVAYSEVVRDAIELCRPAVERGGHQLHIVQPPEAITVFGDPHRLSQILSNLINNAAKYTPFGGNIWITVRTERGKVMTTVRDDGIGIAEDQLTRVFDIFTQIKKSEAFEHMGLGIGLSLVKSLLEMHGGGIDVSSEGEGKGTTFVVSLPTAQLPKTVPTIASRRSGTSNKLPSRKILVVDDNIAAATTLSTLIRMSGNDVRTAVNGEEAINIAQEFRPDLIIMDIGMPVMDGYSATKIIRVEPWGKKAVIVALSGWGQHKDVEKTLEVGFDHHLVKPVEFATIQKLLSEMHDRLTGAG